MKNGIKIFIGIFIMLILSCSSGDPQEKLQAVEKMMGKNIPMPEGQRNQVDSLIREGKELLNEGKAAESSDAFNKALMILQLAEDAAIYNKAE